jgi:hypothetical protein
MRVIWLFAAVFFAAWLQAAVLARVELLGARPNLVLLGILAGALVRGPVVGLLLATFGALLMAPLSAAPGPVWFFAFFPAGLAAAIPEGALNRQNPVVLVFLALGTAMLFDLIFFLGLSAAGWRLDIEPLLGARLLLDGIFNGLLALPGAWLLRRLAVPEPAHR